MARSPEPVVGVTGAGTCRNCGTTLRGRYCHACGQRVTAPDLSLHDVAHEATHEFLHLDGKIVQTLKRLVLEPGALTQEFLAGRRARYISPVRVYLTCSVLFFALAAALPGGQASIIRVATTEQETRTAEPSVRVTRGDGLDPAARQAETERFRQSFMHNLPRVLFVLMPVFALLTWAFYRRSQRFYIPHLYYSIHFHAFVFLVLSVTVVFAQLGTVGRVIGQLVFVATVFPYHYIGLRRVFGGTRGQTAARGTAVGILYWIAIGVSLTGLLFLLLFTRP